MKKLLLLLSCLCTITSQAQQQFTIMPGTTNFNKPGTPGVAFYQGMNMHWNCLGNGFSQVFVSRNCGFTIPANATIDGIEVVCDVIIHDMVDSMAYLTKGVVGVVGNDGAHHLPIVSASSISWGSDSSLWGTTWTPAEINDTGFGVEFQIKEINSTNPFSWGDANPVFFAITYTLPSSVEKFTATSMSVYPNPVTDEVVVAPGKTLSNATLTITNTIGQAITQRPFNGNKQAIDISRLSPGYYNINITDGQNSYHSRILKQ